MILPKQKLGEIQIYLRKKNQIQKKSKISNHSIIKKFTEYLVKYFLIFVIILISTRFLFYF